MGNSELEKIYKLYYKDLYIYAFSICKNHHLTEEVVSDTFFKALLSIEECDSNIKYWLFYVCKNIIIDNYRKKSKLSQKPIEDLDLKAGGEIIEKIINNIEKQKLYKAILSLQENYKEAIIMFYFSNIKIEEIAKMLKLSNGATRNILYRGRIKPSESEGFVAPDTILENGNKFDDIYPYFSLHKYYSEGIDGEVLENHFKDLLRYMDGREEFLDCFANMSSHYYKYVYDYVEENGVKTYGIQTGADIDTVLELIEDERVINIMIDDIKYSVYERGI